VRLDGARAWVTGASGGIGAALAVELAARGARVAISARRAERLDQLAAEHERLLSLPLDVTDRAAVIAAEAAARDQLGGLDLAVFNAGTWQQVDVLAWDSELVRRHLDTNLMGLVHGIEAVLPAMRRAGAGRIAGMASVAGYRGLSASEAYGTTKAAQINLLESLRIDLLPLGIDVTTVCPGFVRTDLTAANRFRMPWMLEPPDAARRIADGLEKGKAEIVFPWQMMLAMKTVRLVPVRPWAAVMSRYATTRRRQ
jgi:short-subunit dehydrogenase